MDEYLGIIKPYAGVSFIPDGWLLCDGRMMPIINNEALFAVIGTLYGGDGRSTFALPDLRSRAAIGAGQGAGLSPRQIAQAGGAEVVAINVSTLPAHTHPSFALSTDATIDDPSNCFLTKTTTDRYCIKQGTDTEIQMNTEVISTAPGGNLPHENMPPYMAINYIICVQGLFPVNSN